MIKLIKWVLALFVAVAILTGSFAFYTQFLVDYSLESLETALAATEKTAEVSPAMDNVYKSLVDDVALQEITSDELDFENLIVSEATARSFQESFDRNGRTNAKMYLGELTKRKRAQRSAFANFIDTLQSQWMKVLRFLNSFSKYFEKKIESRKTRKTATFEAARFVILGKAQKLEKEKEYTKLIALYRQYLSRYPDSPDYGFVTIALANVLIREGRVPEAEQLFRDTQRRYAGKIEATIASQGLKKIGRVTSKSKMVDGLKYSVNTTRGGEKQAWQLKLAKLYISIYRFGEAEKILTELINSKETKIRQGAQFYLAWIYKRDSQFPAAEKIYQQLLKEKLPYEFELAVRAQLAGVYQKLKKTSEALKQLSLMSEKAKKRSEEKDGTLWTGFSSFEQANIYFWDLKDANQARLQLNETGRVFSGDMMTQESFFNAAQGDLRARGFQAISQNEIGLAYELLSRHAQNNPNDAWTQAGLATVHLIMGELKEAEGYVDRAYQLQGDEYTASMVGYINSIRRNYKSAAEMYKKALTKNPEYLPAQFNLACMYIRLKEYEQALKILTEVEKTTSKGLPLLQAKILNNIGYALFEIGQVEQALEKFKKAASIEPDYKVAVKNVSFVEKFSRNQL